MTTTFSTPLSASAQAAYAELLEVTRHQELSRSVENLSGSFNRKVVKGATYWYYQFTESAGGRTRQIFVGPTTKRSGRWLKRPGRRIRRSSIPCRRRPWRSVARRRRPRTFASCEDSTRSGSFAPAASRRHARLSRVRQCARRRLGRTRAHPRHRFRPFGQRHRTRATRRAQDRDAKRDRNPRVRLPPGPRVQSRDETATFVSKVDKHLRVDFLAPMFGGKEKVFRHEDLGVNLQPLRFLEFVLEEIDQAAIISAVGSVMVNVPDPRDMRCTSCSCSPSAGREVPKRRKRTCARPLPSSRCWRSSARTRWLLSGRISFTGARVGASAPAKGSPPWPRSRRNCGC